ncbi:MAG: tRNA uridine-5-carboxymethylaminomethyl(34) synthesis GTPase MnmE [Proteobacteria bacterium]|nr:tRNA uridine-5-carboxymethylaminomethyl(34) synthesis GTPase MnmE [Pseudomonadota bacterium]
MADHENGRKRQALTTTIAAIATPAGRGGVGIIRLSGPTSKKIAEKLCGQLAEPRYAAYRQFTDGAGVVIDDGLVIYFPCPHSFTGEDVVEFQVHGSPVGLDILLERCLALGAVAARPGEFSERAFLNGRIDLVQAEAIADLIDSRTRGAARSAQRSLQGEFSNRINNIRELLIELRKVIEASIDFTDEDIDFLKDTKLVKQNDNIIDKLDQLLKQAEYGRLMHDGITLVIVGPPNVGKSSLLNALSKMESAIVSETPGTTRDVIRETISLDGLPVTVLDTAGLRATSDSIESEGIRRAQNAMQQADYILLVMEDGVSQKDIDELWVQLPNPDAACLVLNKADIMGNPVGQLKDYHRPAVRISVKNNEGLESLSQQVCEHLQFTDHSEDSFIARRRHIDALGRARDYAQQAATQLQAGLGDLVAEDLRLALDVLGEITGEYRADDLLGEIFSSFCIGK